MLARCDFVVGFKLFVDEWVIDVVESHVVDEVRHVLEGQSVLAAVVEVVDELCNRII